MFEKPTLKVEIYLVEGNFLGHFKELTFPY
jgi:hypothetical protein